MKLNKKVDLYNQYYVSNNLYERNLKPMYKTINSLINFNCNSFLDFGCGKGNLSDFFQSNHNCKVYKYDPAIEEYKNIDENLTVDLIANCDVMEHIPEDEIDNMLEQLSEISNNVFFNIYLKEAETFLPNGENAHCTIKPAQWWEKRIKKFFKKTYTVKTTYKNSISIITWNISIKEKIKLNISNFIILLDYFIWKIRSFLKK